MFRFRILCQKLCELLAKGKIPRMVARVFPFKFSYYYLVSASTVLLLQECDDPCLYPS